MFLYKVNRVAIQKHRYLCENNMVGLLDHYPDLWSKVVLDDGPPLLLLDAGPVPHQPPVPHREDPALVRQFAAHAPAPQVIAAPQRPARLQHHRHPRPNTGLEQRLELPGRWKETFQRFSLYLLPSPNMMGGLRRLGRIGSCQFIYVRV